MSSLRDWFAVEQPKAKRTIRVYTLVLAAVGLRALIGATFNVAGLDVLFGFYLLGILPSAGWLTQW